VLAESPRAERALLAAVREHFMWALGKGYLVTGLHRDPITSRSFYMLEHR
jgi:hypothetical protein